MALIRANIQDRLGDKSVYDCIIEYPEDLEDDPMLKHVHNGSVALCLNLSRASEDAAVVPRLSRYVKTSNGGWKEVHL